MFGSKTLFGIDLGSHTVHAVAANVAKNGELEIIGAAKVFSEGVRRGLVTDIGAAVRSVRNVVDELEKACGLRPRRVYLSLSGTHLASRPSRGMVAVALPDGEITVEDMLRVVNAAKAVTLSQNREILQTVPREFVIDGEGGIHEPIGMYGMKLEVQALVIDGMSSFIKNLKKVAQAAGLETAACFVGPLASARASLTKRQEEVGVALLEIGGAVSGLAVFEDGQLLHHQVLPVGAAQITEDLAIHMQTNLEVAERVKIEYGVCLPKELTKRESIDLSLLDEMADGKASRKEVARIIERRMTKIFETVQQELKKIDKQGKLPAGVVLVGGGAKMPGTVELAKRIFRLPVQLGYPHGVSGLVDSIDDPAFVCAVGLVVTGHGAESPDEGMFGSTGGKFKAWSSRALKRLMP